MNPHARCPTCEALQPVTRCDGDRFEFPKHTGKIGHKLHAPIVPASLVREWAVRRRDQFARHADVVGVKEAGALIARLDKKTKETASTAALRLKLGLPVR